MEEMPIIVKNVLVADNGWTGILFLFVLLAYGLINSLYGSQYYKRMKMLNRGRTRIVSYDDNVVSWVFVSLLWIAAVLGMSLTVACCLARAEKVVIDVITFLIVLGISAVYIAVKFGIMYLIRFVFDVRESSFIEEMKMVVLLFGFICTIGGLGFAYVSNLWIGYSICIVSLVLGLVFEAIFLVKNFYGGIGSLFYIFLYLCAAEILPLLLGLKWVSIVLN